MTQQLCCLLAPLMRCIGCDLPICDGHWQKIIAGHLIGMEKCSYSFKDPNWTYVEGHHAFAELYYLESCRDIEAGGINYGRKFRVPS